MAITALPTPPSRQRPVEFSDEADAFLGALPTFGAEANALQADVNTKQTTASAAATTATDKALEAANSATVSSDSSVLSSNWATKLVDTVDGAEYSSKEYASGSTVPSGSAKEWATSSSSPNGTTDQSSKTYALEAATSAGKASASAGDAETSAIQASKLNLGSKSSEPALDNQGQPLLVGATYYDTTLNKWRVYGTTGWEDGISSVAGVESLNGLTGVLSGFVTETGNQSLSDKTLVNPLLLLGGSNGSVGQVPVSQGPGLPVIWGSGSEIIRVARTSNTAISSTNKGNLIDITSGTFTQTFDTTAALGNGWFCYLKNSGTGSISVLTDDPKPETTFPKNWNGSGFWTFSYRSATLTNSSVGLENNAALTIGRSYKITFTVSNKSGSGGIYLTANGGVVSTPLITTNGSYELNVTSATTTTLTIICSNTLTVTISNLTIDDRSAFIMYPGEVRLVQCNGVTLQTVVLNSFYKVFTASDVFIKPPGYTRFAGILWAGGGSGRRGATGSTRNGGGGGSSFVFSNASGDIFASNNVVIGSGAVGQTTDSTNGFVGGTSSFLGVSVFGGTGGDNTTNAGGNAVTNLGIGANSVYGGSDNQHIAIYGGGGGAGNGNLSSTVYGGAGGMSISTSNTLPASPSTSIYGGAGGTTNTGGTAPQPGQVPGGGGGGSTNGTASGDGARGELRIWGII